MPARRVLGGGQTCGVSFRPFPNSSSWWWLISSIFLTRTSCHKTTHVNGYYGAWQGWVVSVSVLPLTILGMQTAFQRQLKFAGVGGPIIFTLPGAERLKTKPLRTAVLSHRAVFRPKERKLFVHKLAAREHFSRSLLFQQGLEGVREVESSFIEQKEEIDHF